MHYLLPVLAGFLWLLPRPAAGQDERAAALDRLLRMSHAAGWFNGAIVAGSNGSVIYEQGFGQADFSSALPFMPATPADGGSVAKTLTAAAVLLLAEQGKVSLTDPVQRYLPGYPYAGTTVYHLITHSTGGLPDYDYYFDRIPDTAILSLTAMLQVLQTEQPPLPHPPGAHFQYDSPGFDLAAAIVERVSGRSYTDFLETHFLLPLAMNTAFIRPARLADWPGPRARGYQYRRDSLVEFDLSDREGFYGGSNVWLSARDLYRWGEGFYQGNTLSVALRRQATAPVRIGGKTSTINLGAWYGGRHPQACYYWGSLAGYYSWVYWDARRQFTVAFISNTNTPQWVRPQLTAALVAIMEGRHPQPLAPPVADAIDPEQRATVAGRYRVSGFGQVRIDLEGRQLSLRAPSGLTYRMYQVEPDIFYVPGLEAWLSFRTQAANKAPLLLWQSTLGQRLGRRVAARGLSLRPGRFSASANQSVSSPENVSTMTTSYFTHARWFVKAGHTDEFIAAWKNFGQALAQVPGLPPIQGTLIQHLADPLVFYSFGPWESLEDIARIRNDDRVKEAMAEIVALCQEASPDSYRTVLSLSFPATKK